MYRYVFFLFFLFSSSCTPTHKHFCTLPDWWTEVEVRVRGNLGRRTNRFPSTNIYDFKPLWSLSMRKFDNGIFRMKATGNHRVWVSFSNLRIVKYEKAEKYIWASIQQENTALICVKKKNTPRLKSRLLSFDCDRNDLKNESCLTKRRDEGAEMKERRVGKVWDIWTLSGEREREGKERG